MLALKKRKKLKKNDGEEKTIDVDDLWNGNKLKDINDKDDTQ